MTILDFSSDCFLVAFFLYCFGFISYGITLAGGIKLRRSGGDAAADSYTKRWGNISFGLSLAGFVLHVTFFVTRWIGAGHVPVSNMYEFMSFLAMTIMAAFIVLYVLYRRVLLGLLAMPLVVLIVAYAAVFPQEVQPLIPALQSYWLGIHVTTAAVGEGFLAVGFAVALLYLLRVVHYEDRSEQSLRLQKRIEIVMIVAFIMIGYLASTYGFRAAGFNTVFVQETVTIDAQGVEHSTAKDVIYTLPPVFKPYNSYVAEGSKVDGLLQTPAWMHGVDAARKLNTIVWSMLAGAILYGTARILLRRPVGSLLAPLTRSMKAEDLDEISYRSIAIGYPIFTLGALIFAMIWAYEAWSRFWGWDPKEVWALISWLYYTAYLHLRLSRGWHGEKSAWLAVIGFIVIMFTLVGVNLVLVGLHSYAGVD